MATTQTPAPLPAWEQCLYWITESVTLGCMFWSLYQASDDVRSRNEPIHIEYRWTYLKPVDTADYEWEFWSSYLWNLLPWIGGHVVLSCLVSKYVTTLKMKAVLFTVYGFVATSYLLGFGAIMVFMVLPVVLYLVSALASAKLVWLTALLFLTALNFGERGFFRWLQDHHPSPELDAWNYVCVLAWSSLFQRATGFALECVWVRQSRLVPDPPAKEQEEEQEERRTNKTHDVHSPVPSPLPQIPGWLDMFLYVFYFPLFFIGPLIVYNKFHAQFRSLHTLTKTRLLDIAWKLVRVLFWAGVNCLILHLVYPHAINNNEAVLAQQSRLTVAAIGYSLGQLFMVKYVVLFGLPAQLARLDGWEPPAVPACISYIYCYSHMWRNFDKGLYDFMKRYIFIPLGGSQAGFAYRLSGSVLCFAFVYYWHGAEYYLFLWCVLNFLEISLEQVGAWLETRDVVKRHVYNKLSPAAIRRVRAVMSVPVFLMSVFAIFYFFGGTGAGVVFLGKLLTDIPWDSFVLFLLLVYCAVQNAMELQRLGMTRVMVTKRAD